MRDLTAQVTSSLLPFPQVTIDALGEDEITLDAVLQGRFSVGRSGMAWLACGPQLEVVHAVTGERLSAYCFSGGGEHPPRVLAARDFSWLKRFGLLVGLEEAESSILCLYDLGLSRVVKAVAIPGRIEAIEPLVSFGGANTNTQHLHQSLRWFFGIAAVVTDLGHVLLVDLCLDDLSCSQSELEASDLEVVTKSPAEIPRLREVSSRQGKHLCLQLNGPTGTAASSLQYIPRTNQLAVGFSDGHLQLWNMKTLKIEYHAQLEGGRVPVHAFTFQEPENDPRNCCYLWAVQSAQDLEGDVLSLHLLQLAFSERKCLSSGRILYEGLEYCDERFSQDLSGTSFPLRVQTSNSHLLSCQTIEKFRPHPDRDDSMSEAASPDTSVSMFTWQCKPYGQGSPSTYIGVFDINRWYHAQMPDSLRSGESLRSCPYLAVWSLDPAVEMVSSRPLLDVLVHDRSLSRGLPFTCPPPEQFFNPTTYNFDATCLFNSGIVHLTCSGYQKETLTFLKKAAPCSSDVISSSYSLCLRSGLIGSHLADTQPSSQEEQLDAILSTAVETSSLGLITGCIKQWTAEEQPGSAMNLRYILEWAWNKVVSTKEELDGICAPLFDSSSNFTDPQTLQLLQHSQRLLGNLSTIFQCLLHEAHDLTQRGLVGLMNKNMVSSLISHYAQVVLWFCRTGLLPEGSGDDALQISRPFYRHSVINNYYTIRREELSKLAKGRWCSDCLMIDGLVGECGVHLVELWKRDEGGTGQYPPPTLHALLDIYLLENIEEATKHAIVIYLMLDVMYSFSSKGGASVESFPPAFAIPIGLVKLVQGLWLLDHHDHQRAVELLLHPTTSQCQFTWQHDRVLQALMIQGQHPAALRYFHISKPPLSSTPRAKLCLSVLLHNRCLVEAWSLLRQHSSLLDMEELMGFLYESCQELGLIKELLKLPLGLNEQECLEKFLQGTGGLHNREVLMVHYLQQANYIPALRLNQTLKMNLVNERDPKVKERSNTRNAIMEQYGKVLPRVQRKLSMERSKPYQHPSTIHREVSRPQPLSTVARRCATESVTSRAGFFKNVMAKIEEVWLCKTPQPSPGRSSNSVDNQSTSPKPVSLALPEAFLGTPITMTAKRKSRLLDLVVHPSCQTPRFPLTPPRPPSSCGPHKSISKAPELKLLQTPQVVKRARALCADRPVFPAFTPQSILRSSLRPSPAPSPGPSPTASPARSNTPPPPRSKESRITFIEHTETTETSEVKHTMHWSNGMAADSEISLLTRGSPLMKSSHQVWSSHDDDEEPHVKFLPPEGGVPSPQPTVSESESSSTPEVTAETKSSRASLPGRLSLGLDTSQASVHSTDTSLEFHDAPLLEDLVREDRRLSSEEDDEVVLNVNPPVELVAELEGPPQEKASPTSEHEPQEVQCEGQDVQEDKTSEEPEEVMEVCLDHEAEEQEKVEEGEESEKVESVQQEDSLTFDLDEVEESIEDPGSNQEEVAEIMTPEPDAEEIHSQSEKAANLMDIRSEATEALKITENLEAIEDTETGPGPALDPEPEHAEPLEPALESTTDLTEFVEQQLFGDDLTSPLTRSGIHEVSQSWNSEPEAEDLPVSTIQKLETSVCSSEPSATDSHSVVTVNDSEELSSPTSEDEDVEESDATEEEEDEDDAEEDEEEEEEEDDEEEEEEDDDEDSGSEVEIIEEVPPLKPRPLPALFLDQRHTHYLSEQEAAVLSLVPPETDLKIVDGEVVVVRLGTDGSVDGDDMAEDGTSYMNLQPSTTLLVPLELMEEQGLADADHHGDTQLHQPRETEVSSSSFSLQLDVDSEADTLPMENDLEPSTQPAAEVADPGSVYQSEVILLGTDNQDSPLSEDVPPTEVVPTEVVPTEVVPLTEDVPLSKDTPQTEDVPLTEDLQQTEDVPLTEDLQQTEDVDLTEDVALSKDTPLTENVPQTEDTPLPEDVPLSEDAPLTENVPQTEDTPPAEDVPQTEDTPPAEDVPQSEDAPSELDSLDRIEIAGWTETEENKAQSEDDTSEKDSLDRGEIAGSTKAEENTTWSVLCGSSGPEPHTDHMNECSEISPDTGEEQTYEPVMMVVEEPETASDFGLTQVEEPMPEPDGKEQSIKESREMNNTAQEEDKGEEDKTTSEPSTNLSHSVSAPEENGPVEKDTHEPAQTDSCKTVVAVPVEDAHPVHTVEDQHPDHKVITEAVEENIEVVEELQEESNKTCRATDIEDKQEPESDQSNWHEQVVTSTSKRGRKALSTPTRRSTRSRKSVFSKSPLEDDKGKKTGKMNNTTQEKKDEVKNMSEPTKILRRPVHMVENQHPGHEVIAEAVEDNMEAIDEMQGDKQEPESVQGKQEEKSNGHELSTSKKGRKALSTPTRRTTKSRKTVTFTSPVLEEDGGKEEGLDTDVVVPASPVRRRGRPRKIQPEPEEEKEETAVNSSLPGSSIPTSTPAKRRASQRVPTNRKTRSNTEDVSLAEEKEQVEENMNDEGDAQINSEVQTPAKRQATSTHKKSIKKTPAKAQEDQAFIPPVNTPRITTRRRAADTQLTENIDLNPQVQLVPLSPSRTRRKLTGTTPNKNLSESDCDVPPITNSRRQTRDKLWNLPLLDAPLEVDSETPVADALIRRLRDEQQKHEGDGVVITELVGAGKKRMRSSAIRAPSPPPVSTETSLAPEQDHDSMTHSRRPTRGRRSTLPVEMESLPPATRRKRTAVSIAPQDEDILDDVKKSAVTKTKATNKQTAKSKASLKELTIEDLDLISPLASPAHQPEPQAQRKANTGLDKRSKHILDKAYRRPVTRRMKL